jgi:aquaporin Z
MCGRCASSDVPGYMIAQVVGAVIAAIIVLFVKGNPEVQPITLNVLTALKTEFLFAFALCYLVLNLVTSKNTSGNSFYGLAIGFTVLVGAYSLGAVSGGAFNPAVAIGITVMGLSAVANMWIFLVTNFIGGAVAALIFNSLNPDDK